MRVKNIGNKPVSIGGGQRIFPGETADKVKWPQIILDHVFIEVVEEEEKPKKPKKDKPKPDPK